MGNKSCSKRRSMNAVISGTSKNYTSVLIFLHGLGDTGHGWADILRECVPDACKIICPNAFDIKSLSVDGDEDTQGIKRASTKLEDIVKEEVTNGIPYNKIVVGGFSQGGALALFHALTSSHSGYAGVVCLSSWLPLHKEFASNPQMLKMPKNTPIIQCHGTSDHVVPYRMGSLTAEYLKTLCISGHEFNQIQGLDHSSNPQEMAMVKSFLKKTLDSS